MSLLQDLQGPGAGSVRLRPRLPGQQKSILQRTEPQASVSLRSNSPPASALSSYRNQQCPSSQRSSIPSPSRPPPRPLPHPSNPEPSASLSASRAPLPHSSLRKPKRAVYPPPSAGPFMNVDVVMADLSSPAPAQKPSKTHRLTSNEDGVSRALSSFRHPVSALDVSPAKSQGGESQLTVDTETQYLEADDPSTSEVQKVKFDAPQPPPKPDLGSLLLESVYKLPQKKTKKTPGRMAKSLAKSRQGIKLPQTGVPSTPPITLLNLANTPSAKRREETTKTAKSAGEVLSDRWAQSTRRDQAILKPQPPSRATQPRALRREKLAKHRKYLARLADLHDGRTPPEDMGPHIPISFADARDVAEGRNQVCESAVSEHPWKNMYESAKFLYPTDYPLPAGSPKKIRRTKKKPLRVPRVLLDMTSQDNDTDSLLLSPPLHGEEEQPISPSALRAYHNDNVAVTPDYLDSDDSLRASPEQDPQSPMLPLYALPARGPPTFPIGSPRRELSPHQSMNMSQNAEDATMDVGDLDQDNLFNNDTEDAEVEPTLADLADNDVLQVMPSPMSTSRILTLEEIAMGNNYQPEHLKATLPPRPPRITPPVGKLPPQPETPNSLSKKELKKLEKEKKAEEKNEEKKRKKAKKEEEKRLKQEGKLRKQSEKRSRSN